MFVFIFCVFAAYYRTKEFYSTCTRHSPTYLARREKSLVTPDLYNAPPLLQLSGNMQM